MSFCPNTNSPEYKELLETLVKQYRSENITRPEATAEAVAHVIYERNQGNWIDKAPNGQPSVLFADLVSAVGRPAAIRLKALIYQDGFSGWFGKWWEGSLRAERIDANSEPLLIDGKYFLNAKGDKVQAGGNTQINQQADSPAPFAEPNNKTQTLYEKIIADNQAVTLQPVNGKDVYRSASGKTYERLTEYLRPKLDYSPKTDAEIEDYAARIDFNRQGKDPATDTISEKIDGLVKQFSFEQWKEHKKKIFDKARAFGKIGHLHMEYILGAADKDALVSEIGKLSAQHGIDTGDFAYISKHAERIIYLLGIEKDKDRVMTEQVIHSDLLGIATRADGIILHGNGDASIGDFKFGNVFKNELTTRMMKYAPATAQSRMNKSKINDAKMEVVMRALMLKLQHPELRFRDLYVSKIDRKRLVDKEPINLQDFLDTIGNYYEEQAPEIYSALQEKGLLDSSNYWGISKELSQSEYDNYLKRTQGNTPDQSGHLKYLLEQLNMTTHQVDALRSGKDNQLSETEQATILTRLEAKRKELLNSIMSISGSKPVQEMFAATDDINVLERYFSNIFEVKNDMVQSFSGLLFEQKDKARKQLLELNRQYERLAEHVKEEYLQRKGIPKAMDGIGLNSLLSAGMKYYKGNGTGIYDFAYTYRQGHLGWGHYLVTESNKEWPQLTDAQRNYLDFVHKSMNSAFKAGIYNKKYSRDEKGRVVTKAQALNLKDRLAYDGDGNLPEGFMPRMPKTASDIVEANKLRADQLAKALLKSKADEFIEKDYDAQGEYLHMPVKYLGNDEIVRNQEYSMDLETGWKQFMANMVMNEHLDEVYAVGKALKDYMDKEGNRGRGFKNLSKFMGDQLKLHVLDQKEKVTYLTMPWTDPKTGERKRVNVERFASAVRSANSFAAMWFQPINAAYNLGLIAVLNHKSSLIGTISKSFLGVEPRSVDFDDKALLWGEQQFLKLKADITTGNQENNKLYQLLEYFHYTPEAYDYLVRNNDKVISKNGLLSQATPMFLHSLVEDFGTISIFSAFLKHMKVDGKSVYDLYELQDGTDSYGNSYKKIAWTGGVRGMEAVKTNNGEEYRPVSELTGKEITRLKRASQKIHGSYRQDERSAAELYALGKLFLQFKKYIPGQLKGWFSSKYRDSSIGYYKFNDDGKTVDWTDPQTRETKQIPVMQWYAQVTQGKFGLLISSLGVLVPVLKRLPGMNALLNKIGIDTSEKSWENFRRELKKNPNLQQQLIHAWTNVALTILLIVAYYAAFPDDKDKQTILARRMKRFQEDMMEGTNPVDFLRMLKTPVASVTRLYDLTEGTMSYSADLVSGDRQKDGKLHGQTKLEKNTPFFSSYYNLKQFGDEFNGLTMR